MAIIRNRQLSIFVEAFRLIENGSSTENAFDVAFRRMGSGIDRKRTYKLFLLALRQLNYVMEMYPCREKEEIFSIAMNMVKQGNLELTPYHFPTWIRERLIPLLGETGISGLHKKSEWIRVNTLKGDATETINSLERKGIVLEEKEFPMYKVIRGMFPISRTQEFREGSIIPHDISSYLVVKALNPKPHETILEVGGAPGIKTSIIQQLTGNRSKVISIDVSIRRVTTQSELLKKWGVSNVELIIADGENIPVRHADKILIDAPCSNSGTFPSDPAVFLRLTRAELKKLVNIQDKILDMALSYGVPTVFSTCSLFPEEGEKHAEKHLKSLSKIDWEDSFYGYKKSKVYMHVARTYPHIHESEGFFISRFNF